LRENLEGGKKPKFTGRVEVLREKKSEKNRELTLSTPKAE